MSQAEVVVKPSPLQRVLDGIERAGNKVPHPVIIFLILIAFIMVLSAVFQAVGSTVTFEQAQIGAEEPVTVTVAARSLLDADGLRFVFTSPVANFNNFGVVGVIVVAMIGVGMAEEVGLIASFIKRLVKIAPPRAITFIIVLLGVLSSIATDAGYLVLIPLAAAVFLSLGRHPLAGWRRRSRGSAAGSR